jgi:dihydrofolate reductase
MTKLIYSVLMSLDGYVADEDGKFDWTEPDAGLVDECQLFLAPVTVGSGISSLPPKVRSKLELLDQRRFGNGMVYLRYRVRMWI